MSAIKSLYPEKPPFPRPKKPNKGRGRPSSGPKSHKKSRAWLSMNNIVDDKFDRSAPTSQPWWKCPMMKAERLRKWRRKDA